VQKKKISIVLILIGIASLFLSVLFVNGYRPGYGLLANIERMQFVFRENEMIEPVWSPSTPGPLARSLLGEDINKKETDEEQKKREAEYKQ
jgi:hypothetical protein